MHNAICDLQPNIEYYKLWKKIIKAGRIKDLKLLFQCKFFLKTINSRTDKSGYRIARNFFWRGHNFGLFLVIFEELPIIKSPNSSTSINSFAHKQAHFLKTFFKACKQHKKRIIFTCIQCFIYTLIHNQYKTYVNSN